MKKRNCYIINNGFQNLVGRRQITPANFRKDREDSRMRLCCFLRVIGRFSQSDSFRIAYGYNGTPASLASTSSRFFSSAEVKNCCQAYLEYFSEHPIPLDNSYSVI